MIGIAGWLPDGNHLVVSRNVPGGTQMQSVNVKTGCVTDLFIIDSAKGGFAHLSPDGTRILFSAAVFGGNHGIYVANLDGSGKRLIAEPGKDFIFTSGAWSPDGQFVILNPYDVVSYRPVPQHPIVVKLDGCQINVLDILGEVKGWAD